MIFLIILFVSLLQAEACILQVPSPKIKLIRHDLVNVDWITTAKDDLYILKYWPKNSPQNPVSILINQTDFQEASVERGVTYSFRLSMKRSGKTW